MKSLVLFDLDGTLMDTPNAIVDTFTAVLASLGVHDVAAEAIRATIGRPLGEAFAQLLGAEGGEAAAVDAGTVAAAVERYQALYRERIVPQARALLYPGVAEGLASLQAKGAILAVVTSKFTASAEVLLSAGGVREHFTMVVGADAVSQPKPHPEAGLLVAAKLGFEPGRTVMVGDTTHDILMAHNAGMQSIAVTYGIHSETVLSAAEPTWTAESFPRAVDHILDAA
ncbi:HAD family hydrolase [Streptacidiphilus sp. N1-3]|uniref:HAD family hydrolase n=1 Tax=Streptacidiphilus alkalitolerans TaxID=3342712 RepID=A0ABV6X0J5_9ACTN